MEQVSKSHEHIRSEIAILTRNVREKRVQRAVREEMERLAEIRRKRSSADRKPQREVFRSMRGDMSRGKASRCSSRSLCQETCEERQEAVTRLDWTKTRLD